MTPPPDPSDFVPHRFIAFFGTRVVIVKGKSLDHATRRLREKFGKGPMNVRPLRRADLDWWLHVGGSKPQGIITEAS